MPSRKIKQACDDRSELLKTNDQIMTNTNKQELKKTKAYILHGLEKFINRITSYKLSWLTFLCLHEQNT